MKRSIVHEPTLTRANLRHLLQATAYLCDAVKYAALGDTNAADKRRRWAEDNLRQIKWGPEVVEHDPH